MTRARRLVALLALATVGAVALPAHAAPTPVDGPVAVMPFKNLNDDPDLDWLSVGMAETMVSDLKKSGKVRVVERDQIDKAMAQIALQQSGEVAAATAVKVGKLVGAKTIVIGAYQKAGKRLRITARFVRVQTGEVLDAAKVTGRETRIFHLQDLIVGRLLGYRSARGYHPPHHRSATNKTVKAYKLYAMAMSTASDATRVSYLKRAMKIDPNFVYAKDELSALEKRMVVYHRQAIVARDKRVRDLRRELASGKIQPMMRAGKASQLMSYSLASHDYAQLLRDVDFVDKLDWSGSASTFDVRELAAFYRVLSYYTLKKYDLALQYGEAYMKRYPAGMYHSGVEGFMKSMINERRSEEDGVAKLQKDLAEVDADQKKAEAEARRRGRELLPIRLASFDLQRCTHAQNDHQYDRAIEVCGEFVKRYRDTSDKNVREELRIAIYYQFLAYQSSGRFKEARRLAKRAKARYPEFKKNHQFDSFLDNMPLGSP